MKVRVKIGERTFEVEVGNLNAQPIVATVDGERFEVWVELATDVETDKRMRMAASASAASTSSPRPISGQHAAPSANSGNVKALHAPIPGVIVSVAVQPGDVVKAGQEVCVLEAMKMKNAIRSPRDGTIKAVNVSAGQQVAHGAVLVVFTD